MSSPCYNQKMKSRGFTLIELLVVISVISLLSSVVLAVTNTARERARIAASQTFSGYNFRNLGAEAALVFNFDEGIGTVTNDYFGNYSANLINVNWSSDTQNGRGNSIHIPGSGPGAGAANQYVYITGPGGTPKQVSIPTVVTVSGWVKTATDSYGTIFTNRGSSDTGVAGSGKFAFLISTKRLYIYANNGTPSLSMISAKNIADNKWHHVAFTSDGTYWVLYIDGKEDTRVTNTMGGTSGWGRIGADGAFWTTGYLDDISIYYQSLTASQIENIYAQGLDSHKDVASSPLY